MLKIVQAIYKMTGAMVKLPSDEDTPEKVRESRHHPLSSKPAHVTGIFNPAQRVDKIFRNMDRDKDARLTFDEFVEGSKQDPTIVQVRLLPVTLSIHTFLNISPKGTITLRRSRITLTSYSKLPWITVVGNCERASTIQDDIIMFTREPDSAVPPLLSHLVQFEGHTYNTQDPL